MGVAKESSAMMRCSVILKSQFFRHFFFLVTLYSMHQSALLATALFIILSSSTAYTLTSATGLPTQKYGAPTRLGLILHAIVFYILFVLLDSHM